MPNTLYGKIWIDHLADQQNDGTALLFVDRHLVHEVTSPQAFEGLRNSKRKVRHPKLTLAVADHNVPTTDRSKGISDNESKIQVETLEANCKEFGIKLFGMDDKRQGIVHVTGPEQGFTQPGTVIVCGDSHTATHGAFGALAFGIGTSEVEHVLATQTLVQKKAKNCKEFGVQLFGMDDKRQGIVHIIGPEQGFTQPGTVIVCGDSHTATHGAFGALAFGIGTSEVEHVLATQTLVQKKAKNFRINVNGKLPLGVTSKDVILQIIGKIGTAGGTGCVVAVSYTHLTLPTKA